MSKTRWESAKHFPFNVDKLKNPINCCHQFLQLANRQSFLEETLKIMRENIHHHQSQLYGSKLTNGDHKVPHPSAESPEEGLDLSKGLNGYSGLRLQSPSLGLYENKVNIWTSS